MPGSIRILCVTLLILGMSGAHAARDDSPRDVTAFVHVTVVPMDRERLLEDWTVIVADGRIRELGPSSAIAIPEHGVVIDGRGRYLMPGLADMHAHTWEESDFPLLLANGVTTIRNMFGGPIHIEWKKRSAAGDFAGPTIHTAGPIIDGNPPIWPGPVVETAEEARTTIAEQRAAGYDFLKVYARLSTAAFDALSHEAKVLGMQVTGHVPDAVGLSAALRAGIDSIEHLSGYESLARALPAAPGEEASWARLDEARFAAIARETAASGTWNCPTLVLFQHRVAPGEPEQLARFLARDEMRYVSAAVVRSWLPENNFMKRSTPARAASSRQKGDTMRKKLVQALHLSGARLLLGTDYGNPFVVPGFSLHQELRNFVDAGLSPFEAIRAGTSGAAQFLDAEDEFGTVAVGRRADLILIEGNPLEDVANIDRQVGVMQRGKWHSKEQLRSELEALATRLHPQSQPSP